MVFSVLVFFLVLVLINTGHTQDSHHDYTEECAVWQNVTNTLTYDNGVPMNCAINTQCTGFDCTGVFSYNVSSLSKPAKMNIYYCVSINFGRIYSNFVRGTYLARSILTIDMLEYPQF